MHGVVSAEQRGGAPAMPILHILEVLHSIPPKVVAASCATVLRTTSAAWVWALHHTVREVDILIPHMQHHCSLGLYRKRPTLWRLMLTRQPYGETGAQ